MMKTIASVACALLLACAAAAAQPAAKGGAKGAADPQNTMLLDTTKGSVTFVLRTDLAPKHAERIKQLARDKFYDNVPFHRVMEGFMAQTGDGARGNGTGKSKYPDLAAEFSNVPFRRGVVGMARSSDPNSANSQFFIMYDDAPSLNNKYTVIGQVTAGMDVVDKLKKGPAERNGAVTDPDRILHMRVASDPR